MLNCTNLLKFNNLLFVFKKTLHLTEVTSFMQWLPIVQCTANISIFLTYWQHVGFLPYSVYFSQSWADI